MKSKTLLVIAVLGSLLAGMLVVVAAVGLLAWNMLSPLTTPEPVSTLAAVQPTRQALATARALATPAPSTALPNPPATPTIAPVATGTAATTPSPVGDTARQLRVWSTLWSAVSTKYVYRDFQGLDWAGEKERVNAKIGAGLSTDVFYRLMKDTLEKLNDDHSYFLTPTEVKEEEERRRGSSSYSGIGVTSGLNEAKRYIYVLQIVPGGPADRAGLRQHDHILTIDGEASVDSEGRAQTRRIRGNEGSTVKLTVRTPGGLVREISVTRAQIKSTAVVEARMVKTDTRRIGYINVPTFSEDGIQDKVRSAIEGLEKQNGKLDGLVIDMRLNGGGQFNTLERTLGLFTNGNVGQLTSRINPTSTVTARPPRGSTPPWPTLPVAVLIGRETASAAEVFSGAMQYKKRATLIGTNSSGNIEALWPNDFEDGSRAWIAQQAFQLPDGSSWEGKGLAPAVRVAAEWDEFTGETDPVIEAAARALAAR